MPSPCRPLFAGALAGLIAAMPLATPLRAQQVRLLVQSSPLAGYNYHQAASVFADMRPGDALALVREPANPHDTNAIRVDWNGRTLGYVPRTRNSALAAALDEGAPITARVSRLQSNRNPRLRVEFEVYAE
jgi:hypothetical protein